jgi:carboxylesterase type B
MADLSHWPAYTLDQRATLLLNCDCSLARDPAGNERRLWEGML